MITVSIPRTDIKQGDWIKLNDHEVSTVHILVDKNKYLGKKIINIIEVHTTGGMFLKLFKGEMVEKVLEM